MELMLDQYGSFLGKHSERLQVFVKKERVAEVPLMQVERVLVLASGVTLSSDAIRACAENGIPISFLSRSGRPYAKLVSPDLTGTIRTRREQLLAYADQRGLALAKAFAMGKMTNQAVLLKYRGKYRKETNAEDYRTVRDAALAVEELCDEVRRLDGTCVDEIRGELLNREGRAAQHYWAAMRVLLDAEIAWEGRETRGAQDLVNSLLNYGYGVLTTQVDTAIELAGLDPYAGFIHVDRAGKPSLVLDLIEEFRQGVVDRVVFALLNQGVALKVEEGRLTEETRRLLAQKVLERLEGEEPYEGKKHKLRTIVQMQARHVATFVRGERPEYRAWVGRW